MKTTTVSLKLTDLQVQEDVEAIPTVALIAATKILVPERW